MKDFANWPNFRPCVTSTCLPAIFFTRTEKIAVLITSFQCVFMAKNLLQTESR
jgi:hypothetical protein